ncbi:GNAT family N-acetyltransferase [Microlunatus soli]|uniref:GCN5-related N-acetyl-transferase n=1 Tax=Microlunatus soli TaxID=630515 RepID=A0A1H1N056_9ACTN|nr:GNAT family N-acetyltransferase [Microlunatus soli]SDR92443.1 GCN5-related N-acetyl-transferase [Microlunatus soli]
MTLEFDRDAAHNCYLARSGTEVVGRIDVQLRRTEPPSRDRIVFLHTETDPAHQGRGIAGRLTRFALDDVREHGLLLVPACSYTQRFLVEHSEYADLLAEA